VKREGAVSAKHLMFTDLGGVMTEKKIFGPFVGDLEKACCPTCGKDACASLVYKGADGICYYRCGLCSLMFASPRFTSESMLEIYENESFADMKLFVDWSYDRWRERSDRAYVTTVEKVALVKRFIPEGSRVLDVGCAMGLFVLEAGRSGLKAEGVEPSAMLSEIAINKLKAPVANCQIEDFKPDCRFQGIVLWDVLEHLYDPVGVLRRCGDLLCDDGYLFLQVPHANGLSNMLKTALCRTGLKKTGFKHFGFPWHVYSFDRKSLSAMLGKAGFKAELFEAWSHLKKEGRRGMISKVAINIIMKFCLSDYIVCVARKTQ
jgi:2-polyprenyl-3-methyl-5-hydroxy-6-metoxy-1,4-benzoquinol methylase